MTSHDHKEPVQGLSFVSVSQTSELHDMSSADDSQLSLVGLEEDLTCSICLSTFTCPVTIPCGHNFCHDCLLATWKDSYSCPQCRTLFATKPELKKNTVLSTVVETFRIRVKSDAPVEVESRPEEKMMRCDTCMEAEAAQTCLTCMASFCEEHLRPHRENPTFRLHQLSQPGDLMERICPDHHKLMELFCRDHHRLMCSQCLQQVHKGCSFSSPEEQRSLKQTEFREKLGLLDGKIERTDSVVLQMNELQSKLKDTAEKKKTTLVAAYQQMRDLLDHDERVAQHEVDCELEAGQTKLRELTRRFTENSERMKKAREELEDLMSRAQTPAFLQAAFDLPKVVKFDPNVPRINLDSKRVMSVQSFAAALQDSLVLTLSQPFEDRMTLLKPEATAASDEEEEPEETEKETPRRETSNPESREQNPQPRSKSPICPPVQTIFQPVHIPVYVQSQPTWNTFQFSPGQSRGFFRPPHSFTGHKTYQGKRPPSAQGGHKPDSKGPDSTKKDKPKSHPPPEKAAGHNPHPKGNLSPKGNPNPQGSPQLKGNPNPKGNPHPKGNPSPKGNPNPKSNPHPKGNPSTKANPNPKKNK